MSTPASAKTCYIGLGSNLGERQKNLDRAVHLLETTEGVKVLDLSSTHETEPVGVTEQPKFLNAVVKIACELSPEELLARCQRIEDQLGRVRTVRWGPRTIDIDILLIEGVTVNTEHLTVPHPRLYEREFVLAPLAEIAPELTLPATTTEGE
jgi:2-amino-4-hydroxy-6-hydroxymethyldihydropteridine diphosphokinase